MARGLLTVLPTLGTSGGGTVVTSLRRYVLGAFVSGMAVLAAATGAQAAGAACEPAKLAATYPGLARKTIKIGADPQTQPYVFRDPKDFNKVIGADTELAAAVFDCMGIKHEMFLGGWSGMLPAVAAGQIDVFWDTLYYTPERAKEADFVNYMQAGTGALTQPGNPKHITSWDNSCGDTYAVGLGTVEDVKMHTEDKACLAAGKKGITILTYPDQASGMRLIQTDRADIMLTDLSMVDSQVAANPKLYSRAFMVLTGWRIGAAVKKGNSELLHAIYDGLKIMQANGTQKAIFEKYHIDPALAVPIEIKTH